MRTTSNNCVTVAQLVAMLSDKDVQQTWKRSYKHVKPFTEAELADFLAGKPGEDVYGIGLGRSYQVKQVLSAVGADLVDQGKATPEVHWVYKALWTIEVHDKCPYCRGKTSARLMFGDPTCHKARCQLQAMRDGI